MLKNERGIAGMSVKGVIGTVLDTAVKIVLIIVVVTYTYKYAMQAYGFGYRIFAEQPASSEETAKAISISVAKEASVMEIGTVLEEKGMIQDARLFYLQELLLGYHGKIKPGIYEISSDMTAEEMLAVMSVEVTEAEDEEEPGAAEPSDKTDGTKENGGAETGETAEETEDAKAGQEEGGTEAEDAEAMPEGGEAE